jgi:glycosyltransferase involved in cell wall biosynthesis
MTRTVVVTKFLPLPANSGGKQRSLATLERLARRGDTVLCAFDDGAADRAGLDRMGVDVRAVPWGRDLLGGLRGLVEDRSVTAARFRHRALARAIASATDEAPTDLLYVNYAQMAPYARRARASRRVLDLHNIESDLMASYGRSAHGWRRVAARIESHALARLESAALRTFDEVVVVSEADRRRLPVTRAEVLVCPNGWVPQPALPPAQDPVVCFVALLGWTPNAEAAQWLVRAIWPLVRHDVPDAELLLVGRDPTPAVRSLAGGGVTVTGTVASVRPFLASSRVGVAPLRAGGGSRLKILEALDAGRPVVATALGAEGLEDLVGSGVVLADDAKEFASAIVRLLRDPAEARRLGALGQDAVRNRYTWNDTLDPLFARLGSP